MSSTYPHDWLSGVIGDAIVAAEDGVSVNSENRPASIAECGVLKTSSLADGRFDPDENKAIIPSDLARAKIHPRKDHILFSRMNTPALVGQSGFVDKDYKNLFLPDRIWQLTIRKTFNPRWFGYCLRSDHVVRQIIDAATGTSNSMKNISKPSLMAIPISSPPLPEQQKIAAILSSVDDVIEKTRAQIDKLKDLKTGMMQELLTKGIGHTEFKNSPVGRIPVTWKVAKLAQVTKVVDSLHQTPTFANEGFPMIRVSDIKPGKVNTERAYKVSQEVFSQFTKNHKPQKGDLLMSRVGSYGVCCYLNRDIDVCLGQNTVVIIPDRIDSPFLYHSICSEAVQNQIEFEVAGSGYKSLSLASIRSLSIALPPDDEQKQIADVLISIDDQIEAKNRKLKAVSNAKKALMQDLLTGKVRVKVDQKESAVA